MDPEKSSGPPPRLAAPSNPRSHSRGEAYSQEKAAAPSQKEGETAGRSAASAQQLPSRLTSHLNRGEKAAESFLQSFFSSRLPAGSATPPPELSLSPLAPRLTSENPFARMGAAVRTLFSSSQPPETPLRSYVHIEGLADIMLSYIASQGECTAFNAFRGCTSPLTLSLAEALAHSNARIPHIISDYLDSPDERAAFNATLEHPFGPLPLSLDNTLVPSTGLPRSLRFVEADKEDCVNPDILPRLNALFSKYPHLTLVVNFGEDTHVGDEMRGFTGRSLEFRGPNLHAIANSLFPGATLVTDPDPLPMILLNHPVGDGTNLRYVTFPNIVSRIIDNSNIDIFTGFKLNHCPHYRKLKIVSTEVDLNGGIHISSIVFHEGLSETAISPARLQLISDLKRLFPRLAESFFKNPAESKTNCALQ